MMMVCRECCERAVSLWNNCVSVRLQKEKCVGVVQAGNISNENAERRADMPGKPNFAEANAFDGPGPETINGRLVRTGQSACCWLCVLFEHALIFLVGALQRM